MSSIIQSVVSEVPFRTTNVPTLIVAVRQCLTFRMMFVKYCGRIIFFKRKALVQVYFCVKQDGNKPICIFEKRIYMCCNKMWHIFIFDMESLPFIRSLYRRIPLEFYGKLTKTISLIFDAFRGSENERKLCKLIYYLLLSHLPFANFPCSLYSLSLSLSLSLSVSFTFMDA